MVVQVAHHIHSSQTTLTSTLLLLLVLHLHLPQNMQIVIYIFMLKLLLKWLCCKHWWDIEYKKMVQLYMIMIMHCITLVVMTKELTKFQYFMLSLHMNTNARTYTLDFRLRGGGQTRHNIYGD